MDIYTLLRFRNNDVRFRGGLFYERHFRGDAIPDFNVYRTRLELRGERRQPRSDSGSLSARIMKLGAPPSGASNREPTHGHATTVAFGNKIRPHHFIGLEVPPTEDANLDSRPGGPIHLFALYRIEQRFTRTG